MKRDRHIGLLKVYQTSTEMNADPYPLMEQLIQASVTLLLVLMALITQLGQEGLLHSSIL